MRALIVSDIHSNLEALESVIDDARSRGEFDQVWSLGDVVGYGPDPGPCIDLLLRHDLRAVAGNHDLAAIGRLSLEAFNPYAAAANRWTADQLSAEQAEHLAGLELRLELDEFTVVHGSPRDPYLGVRRHGAGRRGQLHPLPTHTGAWWVTPTYRSSAVPSAQGAEFLQFPLDAPVALDEQQVIVNPGSVGQPRDGDPTASYAVYDSDASTLTHHRVEYDIAATQEKMRGHNLPQYLIDRLPLGR